MQVYFSHSYRDVPINTYFSALFDEAGIMLRADQKTEVWCMAKLERYMFEMNGFVSIIPRRVSENGSLMYSPYIGRELMLARRARVHRVLFVDDQVLDLYRKEFPASAIPFSYDAPETELTYHVEVISQFRRDLAGGGPRIPRKYSPRRATVIVGQGSVLRDAASLIAAVLRKEGYNPTVVPGPMALDDALDDIDAFESMFSSELCVFVLAKELSCPDVLLAIAHAHCIPSVRLRYDPDAKSSAPELSGAVKWGSAADVKSSFGELLQNYQSVFTTASGGDVIQRIATPEQISQAFSNWDPNDGQGLIVYVIPDDSYVTDRVDGVKRSLSNIEMGRVQCDTTCRELYDRIKRDRFYYTYEPVLTQTHVQKIRKPKVICALECGTCIDFACFFASLLEAAHQRPVVITVGTERGAHAIAGYITQNAVLGTSPMTLGDLRGAITRGEIVLFETTGAVEARGRTVGAETEAERKEGGNFLDYQTAKNVAKRLLFRNDIKLKHFVDVQLIRRGIT